MKKIFVFLTSLLLVFSIVKCGSDSEKKNDKENENSSVGQNDSTEIVSSTPYEVKEGEKFQLVYNFTAGQSFKYRLTSSTISEQNIVSDTVMNNKFEQKITRTIDFNTLSVEHDTVAVIKCTIIDVKVYRNANGNITTYKYGEKLDSTKRAQFVEFEGTTNSSFNFKASTHGDIIDIYNIDGMIDSFIRLTNSKETITDESRTYMGKQIKDGFLKPMLNQIVRELPANKLAVGGSWERSIPPSQVMFFKFSYSNKYNLESIKKVDDDKIAVIKGKSNVSIEGDTSNVSRGVQYNFRQPVASAGGNIYFNLDKGLVYKSTTDSKLMLNYEMQMQGPNGLMKATTKQNIINNNITELL